MKGEETDPPACVNGILMGVIPRFGDVIGDVMNRDHPVGEGQDDKEEDGECEIAQKVHGGQLLSVKSFEVEGAYGCHVPCSICSLVAKQILLLIERKK